MQPQLDLYGSTEAGYLFVGDASEDNLRVEEDNALIELTPWRGSMDDVFQINVTTRDRKAMPLLRYSTGDIVRRTPSDYRILGREQDLFFRAVGALGTGARVALFRRKFIQPAASGKFALLKPLAG